MPGSFLTDAERERPRRFPDEVPPEDLIAYFALTDRDRGLVRKQRRDHNRLGVAIQPCTLRYLGFVPARLRAASSPAAEHLARQLDVDPRCLGRYRKRSQTRTAHLQDVLAHLCFRKARTADLKALKVWLVERAHVTASLQIGKLQANSRRNALTRALEEYGRVAKTLFVLRYLGSEEYRRRIGVQLNKGEALHAVRRFLFFAHQGQLRRAQPEEQANQASRLNLVTNAVIAWNTVYMAAVIDRLKSKGEQIDPENLAHLSPARCDHINPYGRYQFRVVRWAGKKPLRPIKV